MVLKVYHFQKRAYIRSMELTDVSIDIIVALAKNTNKMVFNAHDLVLIKVLRQEKVTTIDE